MIERLRWLNRLGALPCRPLGSIQWRLWDTPRHIFRKRKISVVFVVLASGPAAADPLWDVFEARCLVPYEHISLPDLRGLTQDGETWTDGTFVITTTIESCAVTGGQPQPLAPLLAGRDAYVEVADGVWQSDLWREPRMEVEALPDGYLARETDLEG